MEHEVNGKVVVLQKRQSWVEEVSGSGVIQYRHESSGHCQAHAPEDWANLPQVVCEPDVAVPPLQNIVSSRRRSDDEQNIPELRTLPYANAMSEKEKAIKLQALRRQSQSMTTDYMSDVEMYNMAKPYSRRPDKTFDPTAVCIVCKTNKITMVFFPCEHKCLCNKCLDYRPPVTQIAGKGAQWPHACPVCYRDVSVMFENTGHETELYWKQDEVPRLPRNFVATFKRTGSRLNTAPSMVFPTLDELSTHEEVDATDDRPKTPLKKPPRLRDKTKTCRLM
ncbi:hypothetical protein ACHHYP_02776 [Achlya hypogyna]|uniref:RING-type domain-containing protein n=1 Tax=Achlya hypogyna TaxID=1202772 RepID=A0A1V9Z5I3_ACHHY|nr:hypothetical protein ACHHYP_02776 [Achlya hypogyna]